MATPRVNARRPLSTTARPARSRRRAVTQQHRARLGGFRTAIPFLLPGLALYAVFVAYPLVRVLILSLYDWNGAGPMRFVALGNFAGLRQDPQFGTALRNTVVWTAMSLVIPTTLGLAMAVGLNGKIRGRTALRTAFYAPSVLATVVVALMWQFVYDPSVGLLNSGLRLIGLDSLAKGWLGEPTYALFAVFIASVWQATGTNMILFLAGLQSVDPALIQAAQVDGCNRWQVFLHVELPALRPTTAIIVVLSVINALKAFDLIFAMTQGGPGGSSQVLAFYAWTEALQNHDYGHGSAAAVLLLVLAGTAMIPYVRWVARGQVQES